MAPNILDVLMTHLYIYMHDICITYKTVSNRIEISNILCFLQPKLRILLEDTQVYVEEPVTPHASITRDGADCVTLQLRSWQLPYRKVLYLSRIWWRWQDVGIRQSCEDLGFFWEECENVCKTYQHIMIWADHHISQTSKMIMYTDQGRQGLACWVYNWVVNMSRILWPSTSKGTWMLTWCLAERMMWWAA